MDTDEDDVVAQQTEQQDILESGQVCDPPGRWSRLWAYGSQQVDPDSAIVPLSAYCFMTGFLDCISTTTYSVWVGFQTGNTTSLAIAVTHRLVHKPSLGEQGPTAIILSSLVFFNVGAFCARLGDAPFIDCRSRGWLFCGTLIQTILTAIAALGVLYGRSPLLAVACISASLGIQGVMAKRLNSQLSTTVVLTALWCDLMTDPKLFSLPFRQGALLRDHKLFALICLFLGACVAYVLLDTLGQGGTAGKPLSFDRHGGIHALLSLGALGVGTALRLLISIGWFLVPAKKGIFLP